MKKPGIRILLIIVGVIVIAIGVWKMMSARSSSGNGTIPSAEAAEWVAVPDHGCSLKPPRGWSEQPMPDGGVMFVAPDSAGHAANLIVMSEAFAGSLREHVDTTVATIKAGAPAAEFAGTTNFATASGAAAFRAKFTNKVEGVELAQAMYFFDGLAGRKIVVTSTVPVSHKSEMEPVFDACMKTLVVATPP